jgi:hypothetical protein
MLAAMLTQNSDQIIAAIVQFLQSLEGQQAVLAAMQTI